MTTSDSAPAWACDRIAVVTGASSGIGRSVAIELARCGARVVVNYRSNRHAAEGVVEEISRLGRTARAIAADVSDPEQVRCMFEQAAAELGPQVDFLVNNAGQWMNKQPLVDCTEEDWQKMWRINVDSVFLCCRHAGRIMMKQQSGAIVNIGSLAGHTGGGGGTVPYATAKGAVHTLTRGLARELAPWNIRVNAVAPGMVDTSMLKGRVSDESRKALQNATPLNRFADPAEIAAMVVNLLSPAASYMTGQVIDVNGGLLMR